MVNLSEGMLALKNKYIEKLIVNTEKIEQLFKIYSTNKVTKSDRDTLITIAHQLRGSGSIFGFTQISNDGAKLEQMLINYPKENSLFFLDQIQALINCCKNEILENSLQNKPSNNEDNTTNDILEKKSSLENINIQPIKNKLIKLLLIDEDANIHNKAKDFFKDSIELINIMDAAKSLKIIETVMPDIIILNTEFSGTKLGIKLLKEKNSIENIKDIHIIMVSQNINPQDVMQAMLAGATDYITKPVDFELINKKINQLLLVKNKLILVADDDQTIIDLLELKFKIAGHNIISAKDGNEAFNILNKHQISLAILDCMMPGLDGVTLLHMMKENSNLCNIPVIFLTAKHHSSDIIEGLGKGANDYITKPFNPDELVMRCKKLLN